MKKVICFIPLACLLYVEAAATIIDVPDQYSTIQSAIQASSDGDTVLVQPGRYEENIYFGGHEIVLASMYLMTGNGSYITTTVLDGGHQFSVVRIELGEGSPTALIGFTIEHGSAEHGGGIYCSGASPRIAHNIIQGNRANQGIHFAEGGGVYCSESNAVFDSNVICRNVAACMTWTRGAGMYLVDFNGILRNNEIYDNEGTSYVSAQGGGIYFVSSQALVINNTICRNRVMGIALPIPDPPIPEPSYGGGIYDVSYPHSQIVNCIVWGNNADEGQDIHPAMLPSVTYSLIEGGYEGEGNIDEYPWFRRLAWRDYRLMSRNCGYSYDSPCIDAGNPVIYDSLLDCSWGLGGTRSDMGAFGGGDSALVAVDLETSTLPISPALLQNFPNPFNSATTISYSLPEQGEISISIYNLLGQRVATLFEGTREAGEHTITWDAREFPSGVYFARLEAGEHSENIKMVLLK